MAQADVLIIYTGGTIGSVHRQPENPGSPLVPADREALLAHLPMLAGGTVDLDGGRVSVELIATDPPIDSSQLHPGHWRELATLIEDRYDDHLGFVILHGTDTMAYSASALAFMFDHLAKPIILTGSQRPLGKARSDAAQNVLTAVEIAAAERLGTPVVPEVCISFGGELLRGCRATKFDADGFHGFASPNAPPLGVAGTRIEIDADRLMTRDNHGLQVRREVSPGVAVLELSPLMDADLLEAVLDSEGLSGVILKAYGAGNAPGGRTLEVIGRAVQRGVAVVVVTQCHAGTVRLGQYDVSRGLLERGVISGLDMTPEAAQCKLAVLLADETNLYSVEEMMQVNLKGEMEGSLFNLSFGAGSAAPSANLLSEGPIPASTWFDPKRLNGATLRLAGLKRSEGGEGPIELALYFGSERVNIDSPRRGSHFGGLVRGLPDEEGEIQFFADLSAPVRRHISRSKRNRLGIVSVDGSAIQWRSAHLALYTD